MTEDKIFEILREFSKELVCKDAKLTIKKLKSHKCDDIIAGYYNNTTKDDETFWVSNNRYNVFLMNHVYYRIRILIKHYI